MGSHVVFDEVPASSSEYTLSAKINHLTRGVDVFDYKGYLTEKSKRTSFNGKLKKIQKYTKAIYDIERSFLKLGCPTKGSGSRNYYKLSFDNVSVDPFLNNDKKITSEGYTINGEFNLTDLKGAKQLLKEESANLSKMYASGLKVQINYRYLYNRNDISDYSRIMNEGNLYAYAAHAMNSANRFYAATGNFMDYLKEENANGNPILADMDEYAGSGSRSLAGAVEDVFRKGIFTKKIFFYYMFSVLKGQPTVATTKKVVGGAPRRPTSAMVKAFGWSADRGVSIVGLGSISSLLSNTDFFLKAPIVDARSSFPLVNRNNLKSDGILAYIKNKPVAAGKVPRIGHYDSAGFPKDLLTIVDGSVAKRDGAFIEGDVVRSFNYGTIGNVLRVTGIVMNLSTMRDARKRENTKQKELEDRLSGRK